MFGFKKIDFKKLVEAKVGNFLGLVREEDGRREVRRRKSGQPPRHRQRVHELRDLNVRTGAFRRRRRNHLAGAGDRLLGRAELQHSVFQDGNKVSL